MVLVPRKLFFTSGVGRDKDRLVSFELALRDARIEKYNLVTVSSIFPPKCKVIEREKGLKMLKEGQIVFCVLSRNDSNKPNEIISSSVGIAIPKDRNLHGYIAEFHTTGLSEEETGKYVEGLAKLMLKTKIGDKPIEESFYEAKAAKTEKGKWTTVISAAVFIL